AGPAFAAPNAPTNLASSPTSPGKTPLPTISGTSDAGTTVGVYLNSNCSGTPVVSNNAASFASGFVIAVSADQSTTFTAKATDGTGSSPCSQPLTYIEDSTPPVAPTGLGLPPGALATLHIPPALGPAEAGSTVPLYTTSDCSGATAAFGSASTFSVGLLVNVA